MPLEPGKTHGVAQQVHDAGLDLGPGDGRLDGLGKAFEAIYDRNQDVLDAPVAQVAEHLGPELCPLIGLKPEAENVARAVWQDRQRHEDRLVQHSAIAADIDPDRVHEK